MKAISVGCVCADVFVEEDQMLPGGEALNFCGNICGFPGTECGIVGVIGMDRLGAEILKKILCYPIDRSFLRVEEGTTAHNRIYHTEEGDRYFHEDSWTGGVYDSFILGKEEMKYIKTADVVQTTIDTPVFAQVIECKKESGFMLAVDFNDYRDFGKWESALEYIDLFFISGGEDIFAILKEWSLRYATVFVCTMAEKGSVAFAGGREYRTDAVAVERIVDTTGAGDSYQAGFVREYYENRDIADALAAGSRCASENIGRLGGF